MTTAAVIFLGITVIGIVLSAITAGFENGIVSIRSARLDHAVEQGSLTAKLIRKLLDNPSSMLAAVLLGTNLCYSITAVSFGKATEGLGRGPSDLVVKVGATAVLTILMLIFAEITPKVWFRQRPFRRCQYFVIPIYIFYRVTTPFVWVITFFVTMLNRLLGGERRNDVVLMREDFREMLRESEEEGLLTSEGRSLLENSLGYEQRLIKQLMVPRNDVIAMPTDTTLAEAVKFSKEKNVSRFPVCEPGKADQWIGVFSIYDAIFACDKALWNEELVLPHIRPITTVDANANMDAALRNSRHTRSPLLVVVDSDGKQIGILTIGDVVRPLFGQLDP